MYLPTIVLIFLIFIGFYFLRNCSPLHFVVIMFFMTTVIGLFFPLGYAFIEPLTWRNIENYNPIKGATIQWEYAIFAFGLLMGFLFLDKKVGKQRKVIVKKKNTGLSKDEFVFIFLLIIGFLLYSQYVLTIGFSSLLSTSDFTEKYDKSRGLGFLHFGFNLMIMSSLWIECGLTSKKIRSMGRILGFLIVIWSLLFISVRTYAAIIILGYLSIFFRKKDKKLKKINFRSISLIILLWISAEAFGLYRGLSKTNTEISFDTIKSLSGQILGATLGGSEFSHPFITSFEIHEDNVSYKYGLTYLSSLAIMVPKIILPNRAQTLSEWFVNNYYPEFADEGGGTGFSLVGEAWLNFGSLIGPLFIGLFFGLAFSYFELIIRLNPLSSYALASPYLTLTVLMLHRNAWAGSLKQILLIMIPIFVSIKIFNFLKFTTNK